MHAWEVKLRGFRIELEAVEAALADLARGAVVQKPPRPAAPSLLPPLPLCFVASGLLSYGQGGIRRGTVAEQKNAGEVLAAAPPNPAPALVACPASRMEGNGKRNAADLLAHRNRKSTYR